jgi:hypothetical protein
LNKNLQRPVEFILWSCKTETALIVIPEEAEALIPLVQGPGKVATRLIIYAAPITKNMLHFDQLSYYVMPSLQRGYAFPDWLKVELGIFAGRLYLGFADCTPLQTYLRIETETSNVPGDQNEQERKDLFVSDPAHFLLEWLSLRRKGLDITHTPLGYICQNRPLHAEHAFFTTPQEAQQPFPSEIGAELQDYDVSDDESTDIEDEVPGMGVGNGADALTSVEDEEAGTWTESTEFGEESHEKDGIPM